MNRLAAFNKTTLRAARTYSSSAVRRAADEAAASAMTINFCTPHMPMFVDTVVDKIMIPGESGEYGITAGHSPLISQLKPGVVSVVHVGV